MRRLLLLVFGLPLLLPLVAVALFYGYENWTGSMAWEKARARLLAAGEPLTIDALRPKPIPDADNMAAAPVFRELFTYYNPRLAGVAAVRLPPAQNASSVAESALTALARRFQPEFSGDADAAARVILEGLQPMEPMLDAVRDAAARPEAVWPVNYDRGINVKVPFLSPLKRTSEVLGARATVSLAEGRSARALDDFELIMRLARRSNQPAILAGCRAGQAMLGCALEIVRDGLAQNLWSDAELSRIEAELAEFSPLDEFRESVRGERALLLASPEELNARAEPMFTIIDFRSATAEWLTRTFCRVTWSLRPSGWTERDLASYATLAQDWLARVMRNGVIRPWAVAEWSARVNAVRRSAGGSFRMPLTAMGLPSLANAARAAAYAQTQRDLARVACALERHRLATGSLPARLDALAPRWIDHVPRDPIGGSRYFYRVGEPAGYALYGKGWNARDDGGHVGAVNPLLGPPSADDWVWNARDEAVSAR
jgi:hypothetical protein